MVTNNDEVEIEYKKKLLCSSSSSSLPPVVDGLKSWNGGSP